MPTNKPLLKPHQREVLEWIAAGCPDGVMTGTTYKTTAAALQSRKLVRVTRKGGRWAATVTEDGQYYLDHGRYRGGAAPHRLAAPIPRSVAMPSQDAERPTGRRGKAPVDALLEQVIAAGGELRVNRNEDDRQFSNLVKSAIRFGKVPEGKLLTVETGPRWEDLVIRLADPPAWQTAVLEPVAVPKTARSFHPVIAQLRDDPRATSISHPSRGRALRLIQGLAAAAERRGYRVVAADRLPHSGRWADRPWLGIEINGHTVGLAVRQILDRVPHELTTTELRRRDRDSWNQVPTHDHVPSSRLTIRVASGREYRQSSWSDGKSANLENVLAQILQELELRAAFEEERRQAQQRRNEERRRTWQAQVEQATQDLQEHHRAEVLLDQARRWEQTSLLRRYIAELTDLVDQLDEGEACAKAQAWVSWCTSYVASVDPLRQPIQGPGPVDPRPELLAPFMRGMSPYGPSM